MSTSEQWSFETRQIHAGAAPDPVTGSRATPIHQTTSFVLGTTQRAADLFSLAETGNIYTRIMNPTTDVVEQRVASLEGGTAAVAVASGQAAETLAILNLAEAGDHIVSSASLYGGTYNLLRYTLPKFGIETTFVEDPADLDAWRAAVRPTTKAFYGESIGNPRIDVLDIRGIADVAHAVGVPLIVDNTVATPYLIRPLEHGADIVVHSATKFLGGHGTAIAGMVVDGGRFDFAAHAERFPGLTTPDPSYHGLNYAEALGEAGIAYAIKLRVQLLRDLGPALSPHNAFLLIQGIETLSLRMDRHVANAQRIAAWLDAHDAVDRVWYAGLPSSPWYDTAQRYAPQRGRRDPVVRVARRHRRRQAVRRRCRTVQPPREHRRRAQPDHPPGVDDPLAAHRRRTAAHRRLAGADPTVGRARGCRRPDRRPRDRLPRRGAVGDRLTR